MSKVHTDCETKYTSRMKKIVPDQKIKIVLVETSHPGNIGAAARAMKTMGLTRLALVRPLEFPSAEATARASGADDLLAKAEIHESLESALADSQLVMGTSARLRTLKWPQLNPREAAARVYEEAGQESVAVVFGRERTGLSNEELALCHYLVNVPANPEYSSLNVASAVQILCYELMMQGQDAEPSESLELGEQPVEQAEMQRLYGHFEEALIELDFLDPDNPRHLMRRIRRLFNRIRMTQNEVNILRGILTAAQRCCRQQSP
jgi:TrmH family RNA methyltransferase